MSSPFLSSSAIAFFRYRIVASFLFFITTSRDLISLIRDLLQDRAQEHNQINSNQNHHQNQRKSKRKQTRERGKPKITKRKTMCSFRIHTISRKIPLRPRIQTSPPLFLFDREKQQGKENQMQLKTDSPIVEIPGKRENSEENEIP